MKKSIFVLEVLKLNVNLSITSLKPIVDQHSQVLILGSIPSVQSLSKQQYYGNNRNHFWPIMATLFQFKEFEGYEEKICFLKDHHIALWDVIYTCIREGSLDVNIRKEEANDIPGLLQQYPNIQFIGFNGGKSFDVFKKKIGLEKLHNIPYRRLPSTSPVPGKNVKSFAEKVQEWQMIKEFVKN